VNICAQDAHNNLTLLPPHPVHPKRQFHHYFWFSTGNYLPAKYTCTKQLFRSKVKGNRANLLQSYLFARRFIWIWQVSFDTILYSFRTVHVIHSTSQGYLCKKSVNYNAQATHTHLAPGQEQYIGWGKTRRLDV